MSCEQLVDKDNRRTSQVFIFMSKVDETGQHMSTGAGGAAPYTLPHCISMSTKTCDLLDQW